MPTRTVSIAFATTSARSTGSLDLQLAGHDARDVEEILDELCLNARVSLDDSSARYASRLHRALAQHVGPAEHGVERRPDSCDNVARNSSFKRFASAAS